MAKKLTPMQELNIAISLIILLYFTEGIALFFTEIAFLLSGNIYLTWGVGIILTGVALRVLWKMNSSMKEDFLKLNNIQ